MTDTMKAVVYHGPGDVRVQDMPVPTCEAGGILVQVDACAVCGSDLKTYKVGNPRMRTETVMGHELSGIIRKISPEADASDLAVGDRIVMATSVACGECLYCKRGWRNLCKDIKPMGFYFNGGMAEWCAIPALAVSGGHVVKVPEGLKPEYAALAEPISCAVNSVEQCNIEEGDVVLVMGAGPMGLLNAAVARAA
ncbi:MAG: alcohol dehydrogenase catalytic domain-containing protein, partial [Phycisphaerales bacterium]|nr:alcohol dehydrogenase catalytic domain-containing protein [Phycisphaerales bacterium]